MFRHDDHVVVPMEPGLSQFVSAISACMDEWPSCPSPLKDCSTKG
jgi:hypothetical protein